MTGESRTSNSNNQSGGTKIGDVHGGIHDSIIAGRDVSVGTYVYEIKVEVHDASGAETLLSFLQDQRDPKYPAPLLRRLDPLVLVNRADELNLISRILESSASPVLYITGMSGVGKSTLARGALELRRPETPVVWVTCEGQDIDGLLTALNSGLRLDAESVLRNRNVGLREKIAAVLGGLQRPAIAVLDGMETLLDTDGRFFSREIATLLEILVEFEHRAKVLVTTRRLPDGVGRGSAGIEILPVRGLGDEFAQHLFRARAGRTLRPDEETRAFARLEGNPVFIQLFASATQFLESNVVAERLLEASEIDDYVVSEVVNQADAMELKILQASCPFRGMFTIDMLNAVHGVLTGGRSLPVKALRELVQRSVIEVVSEPSVAYSLHSVIRDAIHFEEGQESLAHLAAADWYLQGEIDPMRPETWDDGLYHLRRATQIGSMREHFERYRDFIFDNATALSFAGWGRRLILEYEVMLSLTQEFFDQLNINLRIGEESLFMRDYERAAEIFRYRVELFRELLSSLVDTDDPRLRKTVEMLAYSEKRLAEALTGMEKLEDIEELKQLAQDLEAYSHVLGNEDLELDYLGTLFQIARITGDDDEMQRHAERIFLLSKQLAEKSPTYLNLDRLAEAHYTMGVTHFRAGDFIQARDHSAAQLRLKLDIDKMTGVAVALSNLWLATAVLEPEIAPAFYLAAEQINLEIGMTRMWQEREDSEISQQFLADVNKIELGRAELTSISPKLLPYYDRAIERRLGTWVPDENI